MKTIVRQVQINDGVKETLGNGNLMYISNQPRSSRIVGLFLSHGWKLLARDFIYIPEIINFQADSENLPFTMGGWNYLFAKEVNEDSEDDGDEILKEAAQFCMKNEELNDDEYRFPDEDDEEYDRIEDYEELAPFEE